MRKEDEEANMKSTECQVDESGLYCKVSKVRSREKWLREGTVVNTPGFASWLCCLVAMPLWQSYVISLNLSFTIFNGDKSTQYHKIIVELR